MKTSSLKGTGNSCNIKDSSSSSKWWSLRKLCRLEVIGNTGISGLISSAHFFFLPADAKSTFALNSREGRGWLAKGEVRMSTDLCPCSEVWQCCWRPSSHSVFPLATSAVQPWGRALLADLECGFIALMLTQMVYKGEFWTSSTCYCFLRCLGSQSTEQTICHSQIKRNIWKVWKQECSSARGQIWDTLTLE